MSGHCKYISHFSINPFLFCFRALRWRLGLQAMQGLTILSFFLGLFFRSASMYHPQRDAISHIKHQKEKVKGINSKENLKKKREKPMFDFSFLKNRNIRLFLMCSSISSLGIYTPLFYIVSLKQFHVDTQLVKIVKFPFPVLPHVPRR